MAGSNESKENKKQAGRCGLYWHVHHDLLIERCWDVEERRKFITENKHPREIETRLRLMRPVKGELPKEVVEVLKSYQEAKKAYDNGSSERYVRDRAWKSFMEIEKAYFKAVKTHWKAIKKLHEEECPNCPWDGEEIVFEDKETKDE